MMNELCLTALVFGLSPLVSVAFWLLAGGVLTGLILWPLSYFVASRCVFNATLRRQTPDKWGRTPSIDDPDHLKMDVEGMAWHERNLAYKSDVHIVNNGLNLYGEYYDFGSPRCVIILSGRTESLRYGYYFAQPYAKAGCNVLVIDPRAHGLSDGEFNTVGFEESRDDLAWARFLHEEKGVASIVLHGICIGAAGGMLAMTAKDCPDYLDALVTDGMFANFGESMKNHLIERRKPVRGLYGLINHWMKHYTGHSMDFGPIDVIEGLKKPLLMLHGEDDIYSVPAYAKRLYDLAGSEQKRLVWFPGGRHSMLRFLDSKTYDDAICAFLAECLAPVTVSQ